MTNFPTAELASSTLVLRHQSSVHQLWHKTKTIMTSAEFQLYAHPPTDKIRLYHKYILRTWRHVPLFHPHKDKFPLRSEFCIHCSVKILQMVGELNITTFITASNGVCSFKCQSPPVICRLCAFPPPTTGGDTRAYIL